MSIFFWAAAGLSVIAASGVACYVAACVCLFRIRRRTPHRHPLRQAATSIPAARSLTAASTKREDNTSPFVFLKI